MSHKSKYAKIVTCLVVSLLMLISPLSIIKANAADVTINSAAFRINARYEIGAWMDTTMTTGSEYTGTVEWQPDTYTVWFNANIAYRFLLILEAKSGYVFSPNILPYGVTLLNSEAKITTYYFMGDGYKIIYLRGEYTPLPSPITQITSAYVTVAAPVTGAAPNTYASTTSAGFAISPVSWSPNNNPFLGSTNYAATVTLTANSGYTFDGFNNAYAQINGYTATVTNKTSSSLTMSYTFPATLPVTIANANITITQPITSATPDISASTTDTGFTIGSVSWNPVDSPFKGNTEYTATVTLAASLGYTFAGQSTATINGKTATITIAPGSNGKTATVSYTFPATEQSVPISQVLISGITVPVRDEIPNNTATIASGSNFTTNSVVWEPGHSPFEASTKYKVIVTLKANAGYTFTGLKNTAAGINNGKAVIESNNGNTLILSYSFPATDPPNQPSTPIQMALINNVVVPVKGELPSGYATVGANSHFTIESLIWAPNDSPFAANTKYTVKVTIKADSGYTLTGLKNTSVGVNGKKATSTTVIEDGRRAEVTYSFDSTAK